MSLPNPGMDFDPLTTLPAAMLDQMVENIEALADGTGLDDLAVTKDKIDFSSFDIAAASGVVTTTTSGPFVSAGISVTLTVRTRVKVHISGGMYNSVSGNDTRLSFALSGANTLAANISRAIQTSGSTGWVIGRTIVLTGLTPGVTTFTLMKSVSAGTGTYFADPAIIVEPY
jgi:hypothetical protein